MKRRNFLKGTALGAVTLAVRPISSLAATARDAAQDVTSQLAMLERKHGGRLGVAILDTGGSHRIAYRGDERFLICSTFKLLLAAAVLARVDRGVETLDRRIVFDKGALLTWAPVTGLNIGPPGMTVQELCQATIIMSDNTAANLLLKTIGGPAAVTAYARSLGDPMTRLDHSEPLNGRQQGDEDTTTPWSLLNDMHKVLLGNVLSGASRERLMSWFLLNQTGAQSLRVGLPSDWRLGDKTGAATPANNDVAIVWPPDRAPLLVTAYYIANKSDTSRRKAVLAEVGRLVATLTP